MNRTNRIIVCALAACATAFGAAAVEPAYSGPLGNPEEPALRPYKSILRGVASFVLHVRDAFVDGNTTFPVVGTVQTGRGIGKGGVELAARSYTGMDGRLPLPVEDTHKWNQVLDSDPLLRNVRDAAGGLVAGPKAVLPIYLGAQVIDTDPIAKFDKFAHKVAGEEWEGEEPEPTLVSDDARTKSRGASSRKTHDEAGGDLLKRARRGELVQTQGK